jgi:hypothetical protein
MTKTESEELPPSMMVNYGRRFTREEMTKLKTILKLDNVCHDDIREWFDKLIKRELK